MKIATVKASALADLGSWSPRDLFGVTLDDQSAAARRALERAEKRAEAARKRLARVESLRRAHAAWFAARVGAGDVVPPDAPAQ